MNTKTHLKLLLLLITLAAGCQASYAQLRVFFPPAGYPTLFGGSQNIIRVSTPRTPITSNAKLDSLRPNKDSVESTYQYYDGLGRLIQTVQYQGSPQGNDMVQPVVYDQFGRDSVKYLPYSIQSKTPGSYQPNAITGPKGYQGSDQYQFYQNGAGYVNTPFPFAQTSYEASPLNRTLEQGAPGDNWQPLSVPGTASPGHTVKMDYASNDQSTFNANVTTNNPGSRMVLQFSTTINADESQVLAQSSPPPGVGGPTYQTGELSITITKDENWKATDGCIGTVETYTDKEGHVVLKRTYNINSNTGSVEMLSTYYVYDDLGHLAFVIPPLAEADQNGVPDQPTLDNLCYQYRYDEHGRMAQKKLPGKGWEYMVYNTLDQVVATQDSLQREQNQWVFTKYDALGRVIMIGIHDDTATDTTRAGLQGVIDTLSVLWETAETTTPFGYTYNTWPTEPDDFLTINYYDTYNALLLQRYRYKVPPNASMQTTGLLTTSITEVLGQGDRLATVYYYDDLGRNITTYKQHYLEGTASPANYDAITNSYDFTNQLTATTRLHNIVGVSTPKAVITNNYTYDHMGRKTQTWEQISTDSTTGKPVMLSQNDYNELGQLQTKHLHSTDSVNFLQDVAYSYNERGWLLQSSAPLFREQLQYNDTSEVRGISPVAQYNGNIASQTWASNATNNSYLYSYDRLNRLTSGITADNQFAEQGISYDIAGNINNLSRIYGGTLIDSLQYRYNGNQLQSIRDVSPDISKNGYPAGNGNYAYDGNGNMSSVLTKEGTGSYTTSYNILNLPDTVTLPHGKVIYTYDAAGEKLNKTSTVDSVTTTTDYISGIQYTNGKLAFIQTEEGRALPDSLGNYNYEYTLADHLGNSRVSFATKGDSTTVIQQEDYMPFGMEISGRYAANPKNEYLYNKKELQLETGLYDYGARFYNPVIGRFTSIDPLAEKMRRHSPYNYGFNNPISFIDKDGMGPTDVILGGTDKQKAFTELQKSVAGQLTLSMDASGKVSYTNVSGVTPNEDATQLTTAIDDHSITVNVDATGDHTKAPLSDAFNGNTVTPSSNEDPAKVNAKQTVNPDVSSKADDYYGKSGANTLHAVTEGYQGAKASQISGIAAAPSVIGTANPAYTAAHNAATPQSGPISAGYVSPLGAKLPTSAGAIHISIFVFKPGDALEINSLPIPRTQP